MLKFKEEERLFQERVTQLRMKKDVSEAEMSMALGNHRTYLQSISSGRAMPSFDQFYNILHYLDVTPLEFFQYDSPDPYLIRIVADALNGLTEDDLEFILRLIKKIKR